jgi:hypothetical protein
MSPEAEGMLREHGGPAFPATYFLPGGSEYVSPGMTLRDWFAGQALSNPALCTGTAPDYELRRWFGERGGVTKAEIVAAQAYDHADAMLAQRSKP